MHKEPRNKKQVEDPKANLVTEQFAVNNVQPFVYLLQYCDRTASHQLSNAARHATTVIVLHRPLTASRTVPFRKPGDQSKYEKTEKNIVTGIANVVGFPRKCSSRMLRNLKSPYTTIII